MGFRRASALVLGAAVALAAPAAARADWPVYGHDLANSRSAGTEGPAPGTVGTMQRAWTFKSSNGDFTGTPVVAGGTLVAGTQLGSIFALDAVTGDVRWSRDVGQQINGSAAIDLDAPGGATAFVPVAQVGSPRVLALSLATGRVRWDSVLTRQDGGDVYGSPVVWRHTVYIGTSGPNNDEARARGSVVALDEASGAMRWQTYTVPPGDDGGGVWSTPAIDPGTGRLYVGTGNAYHDPAADTTDAMLVLSTADGQMLGHFQSTPDDVWELNSPTSGPDADFGASPNLIAGSDGNPLVGEGSKSGTYWALDPAGMKPVWNTMVGPGSAAGGILASTAYDGSRIYGTDSMNGQIWALGRDGSTAWNSFDGGTLDDSPVTVANGVLYTAGPTGSLTARDAASGSVLAKLPLDGPTFGGISVIGRAVYVATGIGPPPQPDPAGPDTSKMVGPGSIIAFGDTSRSGASPPGPGAGPGAPPGNRPGRAAIGLTVAPQHVQPRRLVAFRFRARLGSRPLSGVSIRFAGRRVRTNRSGRARLRLRLRRGTYVAHASRRGLVSGAATIVVGRRGRPGRPSPAGQPPASQRGSQHDGAGPGPQASTFNGRCQFSGAVHFRPALTNTPQSVAQRVEAPGTCSGSLVDDRGRQHDLAGAPTTFFETSLATDSSCLSGTATGSGALVFEYGKLGFKFSEARATALPVVTVDGDQSGSATGTATPAASQDPAATLQQCGGAGLTTFSFDINMATAPAISG